MGVIVNLTFLFIYIPYFGLINRNPSDRYDKAVSHKILFNLKMTYLLLVIPLSILIGLLCMRYHISYIFIVTNVLVIVSGFILGSIDDQANTWQFVVCYLVT